MKNQYPIHPVLVIADKTGDATGICELLGNEGFTNMLFCCDNRRAENIIAGKTVSLIIIKESKADSGYRELIGTFRNISPPTPIIIISDFDDAEYAVAYIKSGVYDYFAAPVSPGRFIAGVNAALAVGAVNGKFYLLKELLVRECRSRNALTSKIETILDEPVIELIKTEYSQLCNSFPIPFFIIDGYDYRIISCNKKAEKKFRRNVNDLLIGRQLRSLMSVDDEVMRDCIMGLESEGRYSNNRMRCVNPEGEILYYHADFKKKEDALIFVSFIDITEQIVAEQKVKTLLDVKNNLIHEIEHRVNNNLQTILSLVTLQEIRNSNIEVISNIRTIKSRIRTIDLSYRLAELSRPEPKVDLEEYIRALLNQFSDEYDDFSVFPVIDVSFKLVNRRIDFDIVTSIGIIINELLSNSYKHAFIKDAVEKPMIRIVLNENLDGNIEFLYMDNGRGLPKEFFIDRNKGLGLYIVKELIEKQLKAEMEIIRTGGLSVKFVLRKNQYAVTAAE